MADLGLPSARPLAAATPLAPHIGWPMLAIVFVLYAVSGGVLWLVGLNYDGLTGGAASKIHPGTYMLALLFMWTMLVSGNPVGYVVHAVRQRPAAAFLLLAMTLLFIHIVARKASGMGGALDTYLSAGLIVLLLADVDEKTMRRIEICLHVVMTVNALMGIAEFVLHMRIFPYRFDGAVFPTDTRSTALQGHPLSNAMMTTVYLLCLLTGCRTLPRGLRLPLVGLQFAALVTYGGRSGMVISSVFGGAYLIVAALGVLRSGRLPILGVAVVLIGVAVLPAAIAGLAVGGFFDTLLGRFVSDGGSANARVEMFQMFNEIPLRDLIVGPDTTVVDSIRRINGLEWGIENPFVRMILYQGAIVTALMTLAVGLYFHELSRFSQRGLWLPTLAFILLLNTSESIAGKTTMLAKFAVMILCLYRAVPAAHPDLPSRTP